MRVGFYGYDVPLRKSGVCLITGSITMKLNDAITLLSDREFSQCVASITTMIGRADLMEIEASQNLSISKDVHKRALAYRWTLFPA